MHLTLPDKSLAEWGTLSELLDARVAERGDETFLMFEGRALSYRALDEQANRVANGLTALGLAKGDTLVSLLTNCAEQALLFFAAAKLGVIWAPLNAALVGRDLAYAVNHTRASVAVVGDTLWDEYAAVKRELTQVRAEVLVHDERPGTRPFATLLEGTAAPPRVTIQPHDPLSIVYTGGTTGLPKGVLLSNFAQLCAGYRYREMFRPTRADRHLSVLQLFHTGGQQMGVVGPLVSGIPSVILSRFSASRFWDQVREYRATILDIFGAMLTMLWKQTERSDDADNPARISWGVTGQLSDEVAQGFQTRFGILLLEVYALSENGGALLFHQTPEHRKKRSAGRAWGWADVAIVDEHDRPQAPDTPGEIVLRPSVPWSFMLEYFGDAARTVEVWRNLWLHTGDLGYLDADGDLYFIGRQAHWLRRRGENISAYEVEAVINEHPKILEAVVVGVPSELGDEEVKVFVQLRPGMRLAPDEVVAWCDGKLAAFKIPRFVEFVTGWPRSVTKQEIERFKLRASGVGDAWDREAVGRAHR
jgi:crotonobetaine/carnitine-CoA ligase